VLGVGPSRDALERLAAELQLLREGTAVNRAVPGLGLGWSTYQEVKRASSRRAA
jgi:hypothetical protein